MQSTPPLRSLSGSLVTRVARIVDRQLLVLLLLTYLAATLWPTAGRAIRGATVLPFPIPLLLLALLLFVAGLGIDERQIGAAFRWRWLVLAGQVALWGVPLTIVSLLGRFPALFPPGLLVGLGLVALMPAAASSVAWSQLSRGNVAVSLGLLATSTLLSPLIIPYIGRFDTTAASGEWNATATSTVIGLVGWIIPAVVAGGVVRWWAGRDRITALRPRIKLFSTAVLLLLNYANAAMALPQVFADPDWTMLATVSAATVSMCGGGFLTGWLLSTVPGVGAPTGRALVFGLGMKNTGMALVLAGIWFEALPMATLAIILYTLTQHLLAATFHTRILAHGETG